MIKLHFLGFVIVLFLPFQTVLSTARSSTNEHLISQRKETPNHGHAMYDKVNKRFIFVSSLGVGESAPASGSFSDPGEHASNFGQLRITTNPSFSDETQMQAAGFLEGYLTAERMFDFHINTRYYLETQKLDVFEAARWLLNQYQWAKGQAAQAKDDPFLTMLGLHLSQLDSLLSGYNERMAELALEDRGYQYLSVWDILLLQSYGDVDDIGKALARAKDGKLKSQQPDIPDMSKMSAAEIRSTIGSSGHCSVIVKVTPDLSDLLVGHVSWWSYHSMTRIYKHYDFALSNPAVHATRMSFSSYPGLLSSLDDWYILGSGLIVTETTNNVYDASLFDKVTTKSALSWQRVMAANFLAANGSDWANWVKKYSSGTYNNQYMVIDTNLFTPKSELKPGLLTIIELLPGLSMTADVTQDLERGYWPSYNVPYFKEVYDLAGYPAVLNRSRSWSAEQQDALSGLKYQLAPRAKLFRRDSGNVTDLDSLKAVLRSNAWPNEPMGKSPWDAICSRGDLDKEAPRASGCTDGKVTSYALARAMTAEAIAGPPYHKEMPPFKWSNSKYSGTPHRGMPDVLLSKWEVQSP